MIATAQPVAEALSDRTSERGAPCERFHGGVEEYALFVNNLQGSDGGFFGVGEAGRGVAMIQEGYDLTKMELLQIG